MMKNRDGHFCSYFGQEKSSPSISAAAMLHGAAFRPLYVSFLPGWAVHSCRQAIKWLLFKSTISGRLIMQQEC